MKDLVYTVNVIWKYDKRFKQRQETIAVHINKKILPNIRYDDYDTNS